MTPARSRALALLLLVPALVLAQEPARARVALRWTKVADAVAYELEIARDPAFRDVVLRERVELSGYRWDALPTRTFHWRVRSIDARGRLGDWSTPATIQPAVGAPRLLTPLPGATVEGSAGTLAISVEPSPLLSSYVAELSTDPQFKRAVSRHPSKTPEWSIPLPSPGRYFLRARGVNLAGLDTDPSEARALTVLVRAPRLLSPGPNEAVAWSTPPPAVELRWEALAGVGSYQLRIARDGEEPSTTPSVTGTRHRFVPAAPGGYQWRVRAASGTWSEPQSFFVGLAAPKVLRPAPDARLLTRAPTGRVEAEWTEVPGASGYQVQLARDPAFVSIAASEHLGSGSTATLSGVAPGSYFLRVATEGPDGAVVSASAPVRIEVVSAPPLPAPRPTGPEANAVLPLGADVAFAWTAVSDSAGYQLELEALDSAGDPSVLTTPGPSLTLRTPGGELAWRVRAVDDAGAPGAWSDRRRMRVGRPAPARAEITLGSRAIVADGSSTTSVSVRLYDAQGREIRGAAPTVTASSGTVTSPREQDGAYAATYTAPETVPSTGAAWILVRDHGFEATTQLPIRSPDGRLRVGADLGWNTSFGMLSSPYAGLAVDARLPLLGYRVGLGVRASGYFGGQRVPSLAGELRADARVMRTSLLASFDQPLPQFTLYGAVGPTVQAIRVSLGEVVDAGWSLGAQLLVGGLRKLGPGLVAAELSYTFGDFATPDLQLRTGGLTLTVGYRVTLL